MIEKMTIYENRFIVNFLNKNGYFLDFSFLTKEEKSSKIKKKSRNFVCHN